MSEKVYLGGVYTDKADTWQERDENDFYPTEKNAIEAVLDKTDLTPYLDKNPWVLDAGAGDGRWGIAIKRRYPHAILVGTDIRDLPKPPEFAIWLTGKQGDIYMLSSVIDNFYNGPFQQTFRYAGFNGFSVCMGNPPYRIAEDWLECILTVMDSHNSIISLLLATNWATGERRYKDLYSKGCPIARMLFYNTRPAFQQKKQPAKLTRKGGKIPNPKAGELMFDKDGEPIMSTYPGRDYAQFEWRFSYGSAMASLEATLRYRFNPIDHIVYERK